MVGFALGAGCGKEARRKPVPCRFQLMTSTWLMPGRGCASSAEPNSTREDGVDDVFQGLAADLGTFSHHRERLTERTVRLERHHALRLGHLMSLAQVPTAVTHRYSSPCRQWSTSRRSGNRAEGPYSATPCGKPHGVERAEQRRSSSSGSCASTSRSPGRRSSADRLPARLARIAARTSRRAAAQCPKQAFGLPRLRTRRIVAFVGRVLLLREGPAPTFF